MSIHSLFLQNFKGVAQGQWIDIKPITVFIGGNSSGKSSCIHALAALGQTVKVTNNKRPLILDDEYASIHLGRFIEVVHSRSYKDLIGLGVAIRGMRTVTFEKSTEGRWGARRKVVNAQATYWFKCTRRTQEVCLESAEITVGDSVYKAKRESGKSYSIIGPNDIRNTIELDSAFFFKATKLYEPKDTHKFQSLMPLLEFQRAITGELGQLCYLGPFRQSPQRKYATRGSNPSEVGPMGESTVTLLANEIVQKQSRTHMDQISKWLTQLGVAKDVDVKRLASSDMFDVTMTLPDGEEFPIADVGYGLSQVLPVLTQCSFATAGSTLLFEQPEIHLHTVAARPLASVFVETAKQKPCNIIIETHSCELVGQFLREIMDEKLTPDEFVVYRVDRKDGCSVIAPLTLEPHYKDAYFREMWENGISKP